MDITYLGHASFRLRGREASVVTDPYDAKTVGIKFPLVSAEIVTISHKHEDHNKADLVKDVKRVVDGPGEYEISGISIVGISSFHDEQKGDVRGKNTIYVIEVDGVRVVHLGDLGHKLGEDTLEEIGTVDVLLIPVGGEYTIGPTVAAEIVRAIEPSITIPMHFAAPDLNQEVFGKLSSVDDFLKEVGLSTEKSDKLVLKKELIGEEQKVVLLERK